MRLKSTPTRSLSRSYSESDSIHDSTELIHESYCTSPVKKAVTPATFTFAAFNDSTKAKEHESCSLDFEVGISDDMLDMMDLDFERSATYSITTSIDNLSSSGLSSYEDDLVLSKQFIDKAIECGGPHATKVPSQKMIQRMGMHTTKQQRAREFLKNIGIVVVNFRTELTPEFPSLVSVREHLVHLAYTYSTQD